MGRGVGIGRIRWRENLCTGLSFDGGVVQVPDRPELSVELVTDIFAGSSG